MYICDIDNISMFYDYLTFIIIFFNFYLNNF